MSTKSPQVEILENNVRYHMSETAKLLGLSLQIAEVSFVVRDNGISDTGGFAEVSPTATDIEGSIMSDKITNNIGIIAVAIDTLNND